MEAVSPTPSAFTNPPLPANRATVPEPSASDRTKLLPVSNTTAAAAGAAADVPGASAKPQGSLKLAAGPAPSALPLRPKPASTPVAPHCCSCEGRGLGPVGTCVGSGDGAGVPEGAAVGSGVRVGCHVVGAWVGTGVGSGDGSSVTVGGDVGGGVVVGCGVTVGRGVGGGDSEGAGVGLSDGAEDMVGGSVGASVGCGVGPGVGAGVSEGDAEGSGDGCRLRVGGAVMVGT